MQVASGHGLQFSVEALPAEMAERVMRDLQTRDLLNDVTLQTVAGPHITTLDLYNKFHSSKISSEAICATLKVRFFSLFPFVPKFLLRRLESFQPPTLVTHITLLSLGTLVSTGFVFRAPQATVKAVNPLRSSLSSGSYLLPERT